MQGPILRKYGVQTTINFPLFEVDGIDFRINAVHASGDTTIMKDEGAEASTTNGFTDEGQGYSIVLTATEMQAARIVIYAVDLTATKVWLDSAIVIETYGHASAMHAMDFDDSVRGGMTALPNAVADGAGGLPISDAGGLDMDAMNTNVNDIETAVDAILIDTNDLQTNQGNWLTATGFATSGALATHDGKLDTVDTNIDSILVDTGTTIPTQISGLNDLSAAAVNAEVVDVMTVDTIAEMAQGIPPTNPTIIEAIMYPYMAIRNAGLSNASEKRYYNNAGVVIWKKTLSDDGTDYTEAKGASGP